MFSASKDKRHSVEVDPENSKCIIRFCGEVVATLILGSETRATISQSTIAKREYVNRQLARAIRGDFAL